ncbi:hypothetical protein BRC91_07765 [Halobacteriales archaeon QS_4_62_28]|nr:MAG: hypothetical protein BRC91_07765 [Halobacteriales archaeon QS_4_62_28]
MTVSVLVIDGKGGAIEWVTRSIERTDDSVSVVTESSPAAAIKRVEVHDWTVFELATSALTVDGRTYHVVTATDQSEQFRHRQNSNILEAIFESVPVNLCVKDLEGRHVRVSERLRRDDAGEDDIIGKTDFEVYEMPDAKQFYEDDMRVLEDGEMVSIQRAARRAWDEVGTDTATLEVDPELVPIKADEDRLQVMLEELFANAIEHGGSDLTVRMGHFDFWDGIFIEDDGAGIPADERDAVFDAGYTTVPSHAGLGATTVEVIGESHGWDIDLVEGEDGGARIELIGIEFSSDRIPVETTAKHAREAVDADEVTLRFDPEVDSVDAGEDLFQGLFERLVTNASQRGADTIRVGSLDFETGLYVEDDGVSVPPDERDEVLEAECRQTDTPDGVEAMSIRAVSQAHDWNVELTDSEMGGAHFEFSGITFY